MTLVELFLAVIVICMVIVVVSLCKGITVAVEVKQPPPPPALVPPATDSAADLRRLQEEMDKAAADQRKNRTQLDDIMAEINAFMTGGTPNGER